MPTTERHGELRALTDGTFASRIRLGPNADGRSATSFSALR